MDAQQTGNIKVAIEIPCSESCGPSTNELTVALRKKTCWKKPKTMVLTKFCEIHKTNIR